MSTLRKIMLINVSPLPYYFSMKSILPIFFITVLFTGIYITNGQKNQKTSLDKERGNITTALSELQTTDPQTKRKLLVFSLTNGFRHKSIPVMLPTTIKMYVKIVKCA